ncbi:MAG TPA: hypothetical protein VEA69_24995, partial [Tepidisphaeraceae bacterium]|nr:hypothetical protein [Tepidisphaeraceae bacterium]
MNYGTNTGRKWIAAAVGALAMVGGTAANADINIGIRIGEPPRPRPVIIEERRVIVEEWTVGPHKSLYDADLRLRLAQRDEFRASEALEAARNREGEIAVALDDQERLIGGLRREIDEREGAWAAARAK